MTSERSLYRIARIATVSLLAAALSGCAMTWQEPLTCAAIGGGLGAVGGGVGGGIHADNNDNWEGAAIALGSTLAGAGIGYLVCHALEDDEPTEKPARAASTAPAPEPDPAPAAAAPIVIAAPVVVPDPCEQLVRLEGVQFASDRAEIRPEATVALDGTAEALRSCETKRVRVEAYTDASGPEAYNQALSQRRADAVRSYLVEHGVSADRIEAKGRGEASPVAPNDTPAGRARNRRVELTPID